MVLPFIPIFLSTIGWGLAIPSGLAYIVGFGSSGIIGGSLAALFQSSIANVAAGSIFSFLTSLAMKNVFKYCFFAGASIISGLFGFTGEDPITIKAKDTFKEGAYSFWDTITGIPNYFSELAHQTTEKVKAFVNVRSYFEWIKNKFTRRPDESEKSSKNSWFSEMLISAADKGKSMFKSVFDLFSYSNDTSRKGEETGWYDFVKRKMFGDEEKPKTWYEKLFEYATGNFANAFTFFKRWTIDSISPEDVSAHISRWYHWIKAKVI